jgi:hypothetical protein
VSTIVQAVSAPYTNLDLQAAATDDSQVNNYMFNLVGAVPLGDNGAWQPYVSGGVGAMTFRSGLAEGLPSFLAICWATVTSELPCKRAPVSKISPSMLST